MSTPDLTMGPLAPPSDVSGGRLVLHQLRYDLLVLWRDPRSRFFTLALPVIFLVLLSSLFGNTNHHGIKNTTYYVPGICVLGIMSSSFVNLVMTLTAQRESGVLKRRRSTPVPAWVLIASRVLASVIMSIVLVIVIVVIGRVAYGVRLPSSTLPAFIVGVALGAAVFCCIAFAVTSFIGSEDSAQPIIQAVTLPLYFISGVFVPRSQLSGTLQDIASVFPVSHLNNALLKAFTAPSGSGFSGKDLGLLAAWGVAGLVVALWRFSWSPKRV